MHSIKLIPLENTLGDGPRVQKGQQVKLYQSQFGVMSSSNFLFKIFKEKIRFLMKKSDFY